VTPATKRLLHAGGDTKIPHTYGGPPLSTPWGDFSTTVGGNTPIHPRGQTPYGEGGNKGPQFLRENPPNIKKEKGGPQRGKWENLQPLKSTPFATPEPIMEGLFSKKDFLGYPLALK